MSKEQDLTVEGLEAAIRAEEAPAEATTANAETRDPLHIGNLINILSEAHGTLTGRVVYRDINMVRVMPQDFSDRAVEFPMLEDGSAFIPELGVSIVEVLEEQESDYYVDFLGVKRGEMVEFFTTVGDEAAPSGEVAEVIKSTSKDSIKLTDGRTIRFRGIGPPDPIAVVRVTTGMNAPAATELGAPAEATGIAAAAARQADIMSLLQSVLPAATAEAIPMAERTFPDSMQREDMFQDLMAALTPKQRTNSRRIRMLEREVDLSISLKNRTLLRDDGGRVTGLAQYTVNTLRDAITASGSLPAAIPVVQAARVLTLDTMDETIPYNPDHVAPRVLFDVETTSVANQAMFEAGSLPSALGSDFYAYTKDLLIRDQATLAGPTGAGWREDQDVIHTAELNQPVQGLSQGLPSALDEEAKVSLNFLITNVQDRYIRVVAEDRHYDARKDTSYLVAPSDPSRINGYVMLPPKMALALRPPKRPGDLPTALLYSAKLNEDNLPTVARSLVDLYTQDAGSPLQAWPLVDADADKQSVASWLSSVLKYAVHPIDSLGPRGPRLLSLLDTLGMGDMDLSPSVAAVINNWVIKSQRTWRTLLIEMRKDIQARLDSAEERTFQSVTGEDSPAWPALAAEETLAPLFEDIKRRNPTIYKTPTLITASLLTESQGDANPLVWATLAKLDARPLEIDVPASVKALAASRAYTLRRKALRDFNLLMLHAEPEINTCPHVARLEAIRNLQDALQRSRLLREFIDEFQGGKTGDWLTCVLCHKECVCYHELMELEAMANPARMDSIQKQILIRYGGGRYEGKIVCKNCGQGLQDIEYDEHTEYDDNGNRVQQGSVLTEEQMDDGPVESTWKKATAALAAAKMTFATQEQQELADALQTIVERGGFQIDESVFRQIVRYADLYVSARTPPAATYEAWRQAQLRSASTKIRVQTGAAGVLPDVMTYDALKDQLRVSALAALLALSLQMATPPIIVNTPYPLCAFKREGWPMQPDKKPDEPGSVLYVACVIASIQRDVKPWRSVSWAGETALPPRQKKVLGVVVPAIQVILVGDPKTGPLSFTPEIRQAMTKAQTDVTAARERALMSLQDRLPPSFRPEPFPPKTGRPALERDPLPEATAAVGEVIAEMAPAVSAAVHQQAIAAISELHVAAEAAVAAMGEGKMANITDSVCCPVSMQEAQQGVLTGYRGQESLIATRKLLDRGLAATPTAGTHMWPVFSTPVPEEVEQTVDAGVLFKLFLKYCYRGRKVGATHEFSVGNTCRQCGLALGKPFDMVNFAAEGAAILASQQGDLKIEITSAAFDALSDAVRRRKIMEERANATQEPWISGLRSLIAAIRGAPTEGVKSVADALEEVLSTIDATNNSPMDEVERATTWAPVVTLMDGLRDEVIDKIGPMTPRQGGSVAAARARETATAMATFDNVTEDPFMEGPRVLQEYWCAKTMAAANDYAVTTVDGARWFNLSQAHNAMLNSIVSNNFNWNRLPPTTEARIPLGSLAKVLGPVLRTWVRYVRPATIQGGAWTVEEARILLRVIVLKVWRDALTPTGWMYGDIPTVGIRQTAANSVANWTRALMQHIKDQYLRYSEEEIKRVLQQKAELERTSVVMEFKDIKDDDERAAQLQLKRMKIGRWAVGENIKKLDPDIYDFETEQRHKMGIVDAPVDPMLLEGAGVAAAAGQDFGFGALNAAPEDGYFDMDAANDD